MSHEYESPQCSDDEVPSSGAAPDSLFGDPSAARSESEHGSPPSLAPAAGNRRQGPSVVEAKQPGPIDDKCSVSSETPSLSSPATTVAHWKE